MTGDNGVAMDVSDYTVYNDHLFPFQVGRVLEAFFGSFPKLNMYLPAINKLEKYLWLIL